MLAPRAFAVDTVPPVLTVVSPARFAWLNASPVRVAGSLSEAGIVVINGQSAGVQTDFTFTANLSLNEGANALVVEAQDLAGNRTRETLSVTLDTIPPSFAALAPADGTLTNQTRVRIIGTLSEEATLTVNGAPATVPADKTFDHPVELAEGSNALALVAVDRVGNRGSRTINVIRDTVAPKLLSVSPAHGTSVNSPAVRVSGDFDDAMSVAFTGPGVALSSSGPHFAFDVTLVAGQNSFTLEATDGAGNVAQVPLNLTFNAVQYDPVDAPYLSVWDGMNNALKAGNTERALSYLTSGARERYAPIFNALLPHFTSIIATYSRPIRMIAEEELGEYAVTRFIERDGADEVFLIYFVRATDGRWLIETM